MPVGAALPEESAVAAAFPVKAKETVAARSTQDSPGSHVCAHLRTELSRPQARTMPIPTKPWNRGMFYFASGETTRCCCRLKADTGAPAGFAAGNPFPPESGKVFRRRQSLPGLLKESCRSSMERVLGTEANGSYPTYPSFRYSSILFRSVRGVTPRAAAASLLLPSNSFSRCRMT